MSCENGLVSYNLELPEQLLNSLKHLAKIENISVNELLKSIIQQYIKENCGLDLVLMEALSNSIDKHYSLYEILAK